MFVCQGTQSIVDLWNLLSNTSLPKTFPRTTLAGWNLNLDHPGHKSQAPQRQTGLKGCCSENSMRQTWKKGSVR